jgi:hypothetical protein
MLCYELLICAAVSLLTAMLMLIDIIFATPPPPLLIRRHRCRLCFIFRFSGAILFYKSDAAITPPPLLRWLITPCYAMLI